MAGERGDEPTSIPATAGYVPRVGRKGAVVQKIRVLAFVYPSLWRAFLVSCCGDALPDTGAIGSAAPGYLQDEARQWPTSTVSTTLNPIPRLVSDRRQLYRKRLQGLLHINCMALSPCYTQHQDGKGLLVVIRSSVRLLLERLLRHVLDCERSSTYLLTQADHVHLAEPIGTIQLKCGIVGCGMIQSLDGKLEYISQGDPVDLAFS